MRSLFTALLLGGLAGLNLACTAQTPAKDDPKEAPKEGARRQISFINGYRRKQKPSRITQCPESEVR